MTDAAFAPRCTADEHCITCGDHAVALRVARVEPDGLAHCADTDGRQELVDTTLVGAVEVDDDVLVHAGVAIARLDETGGPPTP